MNGEPAPEEPPALSEVKKKVASFQEVMDEAAAKVGEFKGEMPEIEDRVELGRVGEAATARSEEKAEDALPAEGGLTGVPLADAMRHAEQTGEGRRYRFILPALVFILVVMLVPLISYLVGKNNAPPESLAPSPPKAAQRQKEMAPPPAVPQPRKPALPPAAAVPPQKLSAAPTAATKPVPPPTPAPAPAPKTEPKPAPVPQAKPEAKPQPQAAAKPEAKTAGPEKKKAEVKPAAQQGLKALPPLLEGTKLDAEYGKSHPGWVRYIGKKGEYKLFKEGGLYRAMQVVAVGGGAIPEALFKRVLQEFGRASRCQLESRTRKGEYVIDQCTAKGNVAATVYRNQDDLKVKGLVVYYTK